VRRRLSRTELRRWTCLEHRRPHRRVCQPRRPREFPRQCSGDDEVLWSRRPRRRLVLLRHLPRRRRSRLLFARPPVAVCPYQKRAVRLRQFPRGSRNAECCEESIARVWVRCAIMCLVYIFRFSVVSTASFCPHVFEPRGSNVSHMLLLAVLP
jgi:hypothetical protein